MAPKFQGTQTDETNTTMHPHTTRHRCVMPSGSKGGKVTRWKGEKASLTFPRREKPSFGGKRLESSASPSLFMGKMIGFSLCGRPLAVKDPWFSPLSLPQKAACVRFFLFVEQGGFGARKGCCLPAKSRLIRGMTSYGWMGWEGAYDNEIVEVRIKHCV